MSGSTLDVAVYGIINAGKSSLINALSHREIRPAGPIGGTTAEVAEVVWTTLVPIDPGCSDPLDLAGDDPPPPLRGRAGERGWVTGPTGSSLVVDASGDPTAPSPQPSPTTAEEGWSGSIDRSGETPPLVSDPYIIRLIDTPGLEEVGDDGRGHLATETAKGADLVLFVLSEDLTATSRRALIQLVEVGKPIIVALNKMDLLAEDERRDVLAAVRSSLAGLISEADILPIAASPIVRRKVSLADGTSRTETVRGEPEVGDLEARLVSALTSSAGDLKALSGMSSQVEQHVLDREADRTRLRLRAERVADETSAGLALALAVNPIPLLDFLTGPGGLTILVKRVADVYGEPMTPDVARGLALELIRGGRVVLWGSLAATLAGGAFKLVPGVGHLAGALTQGAAAGYFGHVVGRALVGYLDRGHDWGDGGLIAELDRIAASTDRRALTRGLVDRIKARLRGTP